MIRRLSDRSKAPVPAPARNHELVQYLSRPLILEEARPPRTLSHLVLAVCALFCGLVVWAGVSRIGEVAVTTGQVIPAGSVHTVQHLEGGIVAEILVEDGAIVEQGQALIKLAPAIPQAELAQLHARQNALTLQAERLRAFVEERPPQFPPGSDPDLQQVQLDILAVQRKADESQRQVLAARISQRTAELAALEEQHRTLQTQAEIIREQADVRGDLLKKGLVSRLVYLETERAFARTQGELAAAVGNISRTRETLNEARLSLTEFEASGRTEVLKEMNAVTSELAEVREAVARLSDRVNRLDIVAPTRGIVQGLATKTLGAVIAPGEVLMEIVPFDDTLVAEVRVSPRDIGHISVGQPARVKITAYDSARFGTISGHIARISPSTFLSEQEEPYYRAIIALESGSVGSDRNPVLPGMVVSADISTGHKTLLQYLGAPVYRALEGAFRER